MKDLFKMLALGFVGAIGISAGSKLWNEVLEGKVDDLKDRLTKKD